MDLSQAFDTVKHEVLWEKLINQSLEFIVRYNGRRPYRQILKFFKLQELTHRVLAYIRYEITC